MSEKTALLAPMPSAMTSTAVRAKPGVRVERPPRVAQILAQDVRVHSRRVDEDVADRVEPEHRDRPDSAGAAAALDEHGAQLVTVFAPEAGGIEKQERAVESHQVISRRV